MKSLLAALLASASLPAWAGGVSILKGATPVPALDEAGVLLLAVVVGGGAGWVVKRNRRK